MGSLPFDYFVCFPLFFSSYCNLDKLFRENVNPHFIRVSPLFSIPTNSVFVIEFASWSLQTSKYFDQHFGVFVFQFVELKSLDLLLLQLIISFSFKFLQFSVSVNVRSQFGHDVLISFMNCFESRYAIHLPRLISPNLKRDFLSTLRIFQVSICLFYNRWTSCHWFMFAHFQESESCIRDLEIGNESEAICRIATPWMKLGENIRLFCVEYMNFKLLKWSQLSVDVTFDVVDCKFETTTHVFSRF